MSVLRKQDLEKAPSEFLSLAEKTAKKAVNERLLDTVQAAMRI